MNRSIILIISFLVMWVVADIIYNPHYESFYNLAFWREMWLIGFAYAAGQWIGDKS